MPVELRGDCERCFGLCCVGPSLTRSADFAIDKPAGSPCPQLGADHRCGIHAQLRERGFPGCDVFDCFGAGQRVAQHTFGGRNWRQAPATAGPMFQAFAIMQRLHELLWHLGEALTLAPARALRPELAAALAATERLAEGPPEEVLAVDVDAHRDGVRPLLSQVSELVRAMAGGRRLNRRGVDLIGRDLRRDRLRGADLRGAYLIGADLRGVDLSYADLIGADLRGANLAGADLAGGIFLTQPQVRAARGDAATRLPARLTRPGHWRPAPAGR